MATAKQERNSHFVKGTVACRVCGKTTRETGKGEHDVKLCAGCIALTETENGISDNGVQYYDAAARTIQLEACRERCRQNRKRIYEPMAHVLKAVEEATR